MNIEFTLPIKPFSVNAYRYRDARFKTKEARTWEELVKGLLEDYKELTDMRLDFEALGGEFSVHISVRYPPEVFYNKSRAISAKTIDITNFEKPLIDIIFKEAMGVDDRFITELTSEKRVGSSYQIRVRIEHLSTPR